MLGSSEKVIGTHDGTFHADEVLGCYLLTKLPEYSNATIKRSRDMEILNTCDIVIDVGAEYDHSKKRYDHHQRGFCETMKSITGLNEEIKLSSAGLIWAHYGKDVIKATFKEEPTPEDLKALYIRIYVQLIKEIDAKDNGIETGNPPLSYRVNTDLSSRIARLSRGVICPNLNETERFYKAMELAGNEYTEIITELELLWLPSKMVVSEAIDNRFSVHSSGLIINLKDKGVSWFTHLRDLEKEKGTDRILYVIFQDQKKNWRVQAVPIDAGFMLRKPVLSHCKGLRGDELIRACGVMDATFVHATGFIGGANSYEGALEMALLSISEKKTSEKSDT